MSNLFEAMNQTSFTENGALTNTTSLNKVVDLFFQIGSARGRILKTEFAAAFGENPEMATRCLLWSRDVRGGAGEREQFRQLMQFAVKSAIMSDEVITRVIAMIPEIGRFDDLLAFVDTPYQNTAFDVIAKALREQNGLAAKWMPRQGPVAKALRKYMGIATPKDWRKMLVELSNTVEQDMCAQNWDNINFEHVPSVASARYQGSFSRHQPTRYANYRDSLAKGEAKINASAVFPHDVVKGMKQGNAGIANEQWKSLPDYMEGTDERILSVVDVSGSMGQLVSGQTSAMDVAIALGLYTSERLTGAFKDMVLTFSAEPQLQHITGASLSVRYNAMQRMNWDMNTDFNKAFRVLLNQAVKNDVPAYQMPTKVLVISDMEFDSATSSRWGNQPEVTNFDALHDLYEKAGYEMPTMVFWNVCARNSGNLPVTVRDENTALVSGFSTSILKNLLGGKLDPTQVVYDTLMVERYNIENV